MVRKTTCSNLKPPGSELIHSRTLAGRETYWQAVKEF